MATLVYLFCAVLMVQGALGFFTGFGSGHSTDSAYDYLGLNSALPLYTTMFKEMNNFDRSFGMGGIGLGMGLLGANGGVSYPGAAAASGYGGGYGSNNGGYRNKRSLSDLFRQRL